MYILIADDDDDIREVLALVLRFQGHHVEEAVDGLDALAQMRAGGRPSLILLDLMMPRLDGEGVVKAMRSDPALADIRICILSGHADAREKAANLGVIGCLVKPLELHQLFAIVAQVAATTEVPL
jgi:CheY-like chemotaxis protein